MEVNPLDIIAEVDRIANPQSSADELRDACEKVRRLLKGNVPSVMLQSLFIAGKQEKPDNSLKDEVEKLHRQVNDLINEKSELESQIDQLREELRQINHRMMEPARDGFFSMEQFMFVLLRRLRRSYGWRTDYINATQCTPGATPVMNETVQKWKNHDQVPAWAIDEIEKLEFKPRTGISGVPWSDDNEAFLMRIYNENPIQSNVSLAQQCEREFGRTIGENAVKGALDRLRRQKKLPPKRPRQTKPQ